MPKLTRYTDIVRQIPEVPADAIGCAEWVHKVLCQELARVIGDPALVGESRRIAIEKLSMRVISATPHSELYKAREVVKGEEAKIAGVARLQGTLVKSVPGGTGYIRADAPRGRSKPS